MDTYPVALQCQTGVKSRYLSPLAGHRLWGIGISAVADIRMIGDLLFARR
jgi:hypothetical protein